MLHNIIGLIFDSKHGNCLSSFSFFFISFSAERRQFFKIKRRRKEETLDNFLTQKKENLGQACDSTAYIYMYVL